MKAMVFPGKYYQGDGAIKELGNIVASFGSKKPMIVWGKRAKQSVVDQIDPAMKEKGISYEEYLMVTDCTHATCDAISEEVRKTRCDIVVGIGGGKVLDMAKAVAMQTKNRVIIVPSVTASDAPTSACTVWYDDEGVCQGFDLWPVNPDVVLVDTRVSVQAPAKMLVAGIGDALATYLEARANCTADVETCAGGTPTETVLPVAKLCFDLLMDNGEEAVMAAEAGVVTTPFEKVIEATVLLSGLGWENGGVCTAHDLGNNLTYFPETHAYMHGDKVAMGIVTQLMMERKMTSKEKREIVEFMVKVGLAVCFEDLNMQDVSKERIHEWCVKYIDEDPNAFSHHHPFKVTADMVCDAMIAANIYGKKIKDEIKGK